LLRRVLDLEGVEKTQRLGIALLLESVGELHLREQHPAVFLV
jgi:hypothetical protein